MRARRLIIEQNTQGLYRLSRAGSNWSQARTLERALNLAALAEGVGELDEVIHSSADAAEVIEKLLGPVVEESELGHS